MTVRRGAPGKPLVWALGLALASLIVLLSPPTAGVLADTQGQPAQTPPNISVILVIDNSGSMKEADPLGLRYVAARQMVDSLEEGDEVSVILFSDRSTLLVSQPTRVSGSTRAGIEERIRTQPASGDTNMSAALATAAAELGKMTNPTKFAIFLTDGELHPPGWSAYTPQQQDAERQKVFGLAETFGAAQAPIFTVALREAVDPQFLQELATRSGGSAHQAATPEQVPIVFQRIFAAQKLDIFEILYQGSLAAGADAEISFPVHRFIRSLTIFVTYASDQTPTISLLPPGTSAPVGPVRKGTYEVYKLAAPQRGRWRIIMKGHPSSDTTLVVSSIPRASVDVTWNSPTIAISTGTSLRAEVTVTAVDPLTGSPIPVTGAEASLTVVGPDQGEHQISLAEVAPGRYERDIQQVLQPGAYFLRLIIAGAEGTLAQRELRPTATGLAITPSPVVTPTPSPSPTPTPTVAVVATPVATPAPVVSAQPSDNAGFPVLWLLAPAALLALLIGGVGLAAARPDFPSDFALYSELGLSYFKAIDLRRRLWRRVYLIIGGPQSDIDLDLEGPVARLEARGKGGVAIRRLRAGVEITVNSEPVEKSAPIPAFARLDIDGHTLLTGTAYLLSRNRRGPSGPVGVED